MLLWRVIYLTLSFICIHCIINSRHTKEKGRLWWVLQSLQERFCTPIWPCPRQSFEPSTLTRRPNNYNCEFYMRSQVAISELAETVSANIKYTEENREILDQKSITAFLSGSPLSPIWQSWLVKRGTNYLRTAIIYIKIISVT